MQHQARLIISYDGLDKSYILWNGTESYYKKLRAAYTDILNDKESDYLYFGFFTLCAATLEYSLNTVLTDYCVNKFGHDNYKSYAEGYINISFAKKLLMSPHIISDGEFCFNEDNSSYKNLLELIALRNKILHNKEFLKEIEFPSIADNLDKETIEFTLTKDADPIDKLNKDVCLNFGKSLGDFKKFIMDPSFNNELIENEMIKEYLEVN